MCFDASVEFPVAHHDAFPPNDLLWMILAQCDKRTCVNAARVCHGWYEPAASEVWRDVPGLRVLFGALCPLKQKMADPDPDSDSDESYRNYLVGQSETQSLAN